MADEQKKDNEFPLGKTADKQTSEERTRATPKPLSNSDTRDRTDELPATAVDEDKLAEMRKAANETANQTIDEGNENEVQGKLAVPHVKVMKRGSTKWTDEDGNYHREINDEEVNARLADEATPDYLKLHQEVLEGADPIEATIAHQNADPDEQILEGKLADAELYPRTRGLGPAVEVDNG